MPQLSLYIDDETMGVLRKSANERDVSLSRYARDLISSQSESAWPSDFWDVYGALEDDSFVVPEGLNPPFDSPADFDAAWA